MLSVLVLSKNSEDLIKNCLESIKDLADEIVVVDNHSTDKSAVMAKDYTSKVIVSDFKNFSDGRNLLLKHSTGDWLFYVDTDERVSLQLREEISALITNHQSPITAYAFPRKNILLGKWQKHGSWWPDYQIRLFKKSALKNWKGDLHERPEFEGGLGYLKNPLIHLTHRDISSMLAKTTIWSQTEAKLRYDVNHPKMTGWRFIRVVKVELFRQFFKGGWKDGTEGIIEIFYQAFSLFISYVKLWEAQRKEKLKDTYQRIDDELIKSNFNDSTFNSK